MLTMSRAAKAIQIMWRRNHAQKMYLTHLKQRLAAICMQRIWLGCRARLHYNTTKAKAIHIQWFYRGYLGRRQINDLSISATTIQRVWRSFSIQLQYQIVLMDIISVQCIARGRTARCHYNTAKTKAIQIQSCSCGYLVRRQRNDLRINATAIQRVWRSFSAQLRYQMVLMDIILVQCVARRRAAHKELLQRRGSALKMQQAARRWLALRQPESLREERDATNRLVEATVACQVSVWTVFMILFFLV